MRRECRERFPRHRLQRKPLISDPDMHHVPWCMSVSLNRGSGGKRSRHSRRMRNQQFYVSVMRPMIIFQLLRISQSVHSQWMQQKETQPSWNVKVQACLSHNIFGRLTTFPCQVSWRQCWNCFPMCFFPVQNFVAVVEITWSLWKSMAS